MELEKMLSYNDALKIVKKNILLLEKREIEVELLNSVNHILSNDILSDVNQPAFDNSAVDGYAIIFGEKVNSWKLIGEIRAGNFSEFSLSETTAVSIMTGGKIPKGCTAVIPIEDVIVENNVVQLKAGVKIFSGKNIRKKGENLKLNQVAVAQNTLISTANISALADCGCSTVKVYKPLKVAVLSTGDELVDLDETPTEDKIRATNVYSILSLLKQFNLDGVNLGFSNDDKEAIKEKIKLTLESDVDILLTTGGVSVGKYDFLKEVFAELGIERKFWRVYIKPGKPIYFGVFEKDGKYKLIFGLAGNPVSSFVNIYAFLIPALEEYYKIKFNNQFYARVKSVFKKHDSKRHFVRGNFKLCNEDQVLEVSNSNSQSSGNMAGLSNANCLIILDEEKQIYEKGELVKCIKI
ncbi:MAG: molybdopterin molybdotransferase MoeA [Melioribacteraceae bacterium]|nr:molybdopterin molybdotransferase MoeA [Melioribacteraceae bacterium]